MFRLIFDVALAWCVTVVRQPNIASEQQRWLVRQVGRPERMTASQKSFVGGVINTRYSASLSLSKDTFGTSHIV